MNFEPIPNDEWERIREHFLGEDGASIRDVMFETGLGRAPTNARGIELATALGWLDSCGRLTPSGQVAKDPIREHRFWTERHHEMPAQREAPILAPGRFAGLDVLEVGSGGGCNLLSLAKLGQTKRLCGVDPVPAYLQFAALLAELEGIDVPEMLRGSASEIPYEDESFDVVVCISSMQYTKPATGSREMARVLRPGGKWISVHNTLGPFAVETVTRFMRGRSLGTLRYDLGAIANSITVMGTGRRWFGRQGGMSTARPLYPSRRYWRRTLSAERLSLQRCEQISSGESVFVATKR